MEIFGGRMSELVGNSEQDEQSVEELQLEMATEILAVKNYLKREVNNFVTALENNGELASEAITKTAGGLTVAEYGEKVRTIILDNMEKFHLSPDAVEKYRAISNKAKFIYDGKRFDDLGVDSGSDIMIGETDESGEEVVVENKNILTQEEVNFVNSFCEKVMRFYNWLLSYREEKFTITEESLFGGKKPV